MTINTNILLNVQKLTERMQSEYSDIAPSFFGIRDRYRIIMGILSHIKTRVSDYDSETLEIQQQQDLQQEQQQQLQQQQQQLQQQQQQQQQPQQQQQQQQQQHHKHRHNDNVPALR